MGNNLVSNIHLSHRLAEAVAHSKKRIRLLFVQLGDNCIQIFLLGRYIIGYTVGNLVLRRRASGAVKRDFRTYIRRYTSLKENFKYSYPHSNALLQFDLKLERCKPHKAARHPTKGDVIDDVKLFPTVYHRIYCRKFFDVIQSDVALQAYYKCIRMCVYPFVFYPVFFINLYASFFWFSTFFSEEENFNVFLFMFEVLIFELLLGVL